MASATQEEEESLIEERLAEMVSSSVSGGKPFSRIAHFLKPSFPQTHLTTPPPPTHLTSMPTSPLLKFRNNVHFNGWKITPMNHWNSWIEKMRALHEPTWRKSAIFEPIMSSKLEIPRCSASMFVFADKWCPETSSFVMPWGEVSITLEDIRVLGGYSVTGDSVFKPLSSKKLLEIEEKLLTVRVEMCRSKCKKASQQQWLENWMDKGADIEHEAFLCLWLSRYVLPADDLSTINKSVIRIAVLLAGGTRIALAPPVLASIYRDLRLLKGKIESLRNVGDQEGKNVTKLKLWAPLQLLQAWVWERFPDLSPAPKRITGGLSRLERWNKVVISKNEGVGEAVDSAAETFIWRPYSTPLNNWSANLYPEKGEWVSVHSDVGFGFDLESYVRCVRTSELVGLEDGCVEKYLPHRVSMQFGLDQDIPHVLRYPSDKTMTVWTDYDRPVLDVRLYVPSKLFESDVTVQYLEWWKKSETKKGNVGCSFEGSLKASTAWTRMLEIKKEMNEAEVPPGFTPKDQKRELFDDLLCDPPNSKRSKESPRHDNSKTKSDNANVSSHPSPLCKGVKVEDDYDDHLPLSQLFQSGCSQRPCSSSSIPVIDLDSPPSSAGDNEPLHVVDNSARATGPIECKTIEITTEDGISNSVLKSSGMDALDRIARLERIVNFMKAAKVRSDLPI